jgi:hypothetical protein
VAPILIILIVLLVVVVAGSFVRRGAAAIRAADAEAASALRLRILQMSVEELGVTAGADEPFAVVMDLAYPPAVVSVVSVATGDASVYFSTGGGMIGGIGHESVRDAAIAFVAETRKHVAQFTPTSDLSFPAAGEVRFLARTPNDVRVAGAREPELREGQHPLSPLYTAGQNVITALREIHQP